MLVYIGGRQLRKINIFITSEDVEPRGQFSKPPANSAEVELDPYEESRSGLKW